MKMRKKTAAKAKRRHFLSHRGWFAKKKAAMVVPRSSDIEVRRLSHTYHLSNEALSRVTGASPRTVSYWNAGAIAPQRSSAHKLKEVTRLFDALSDIIKANAIGPWLQKPNKRFDGSTPLQVIERGESDRIWRMIWELREGKSG